MRQKTRSSAQSSRSSTKEPIAEGLQVAVPLDSRGRRIWSRLTDVQVVAFTRKLIQDEGITGRTELQIADSGLCTILRKRGLIGEIGLDRKFRSFKEAGNEELVELARGVLEEKGVARRRELEKADPALYDVLRRRGLLDRVGFEDKRRSWKDMGNDEILEIAKNAIKENGITKKRELNDVDSGLYSVLWKRGLLDLLEFEEKRTYWKEISDEELIELAKKVMRENGISGRKELEDINSGIYNNLRKRGLLSRIGFERKRKKKRSWNDVSDEELLELARKLIEENGICSRLKFKGADSGLHEVLRLRNLLDMIKFKEKRRIHASWKDMTDEEIVEFARKLIRDKDITTRKELRTENHGLLAVLGRRGLLTRAFAHIEQKKEDMARDAVIDALEAFAANDHAISEDDVA